MMLQNKLSYKHFAFANDVKTGGKGIDVGLQGTGLYKHALRVVDVNRTSDVVGRQLAHASV